MAITLFGSVSVPTDNGTNAASPTAFANPPIASMTTGDLVFVWAWSRTASSTIAVSNAGGQSWNSFTSQSSGGATLSANAFWCRYNGTWSAAPSFSFSGTLNGTSVYMIVFRPTNTSCTWAVSAAQTGTFVSRAAAASFTITGWTPGEGGNNVNIGVWCTDDDNTWGTLTGTNWSKTSLTAQIRNLGGSDSSASFAYQIQSAAAATNNVSQTETALGNDGGFTFAICFVEVDPTLIDDYSTAHRNIEQPYFPAPKLFNYGMRSGAVIDFDTDARTFINNVGITDTTQRLALNQLVEGLKSAGLWTKMDAIYPFVGGTEAKHKYNLKNPVDSDAAYRGTFDASMTHALTGVTDTTGQGMNTHYNPFVVGVAQNSAHFSVYIRTDDNGNQNIDMLAFDIPNDLYWDFDRVLPSGPGIFVRVNDGNLPSRQGSSNKAYYICTRTGTTTLKGYRNGVEVFTDSSSFNNGVPNAVLLACHGGGIGGSSAEYAFASMGSGLTAAEAAGLNVIVEAYNDALGRGVQ